MIILITTIMIVVIGIVVGAGLVFAGKKFFVPVDEREAAVREVLPGNNCGACGFAGCDAMAAAIVAGDAPVNGCPVGGAPVAEKIGGIMGKDAQILERQVAFVRCKGTCANTKKQGNYVGVTDCRTAAFSGVNVGECDYGCMGLGSCVNVCPQHAITLVDGVLCVKQCEHDAIHMEGNVAKINYENCTQCGKCAEKCPSKVITRPLAQ